MPLMHGLVKQGSRLVGNGSWVETVYVEVDVEIDGMYAVDPVILVRFEQRELHRSLEQHCTWQMESVNLPKIQASHRDYCQYLLLETAFVFLTEIKTEFHKLSVTVSYYFP